MPTILRERGYRFFFYMADRYEPPHIHVQGSNGVAKLWLSPVTFAFVNGFRPHQCSEVVRLVKLHLDEFHDAWYGLFGNLDHD